MASRDLRLPATESRPTRQQRVVTGHREFKFYSFGLRAGLANLRANGLALGVKKTVGKISQPINSHTRFPEYDLFERAIAAHLIKNPTKKTLRILDVGSPKLFGLYLAVNRPVHITLSDITALNIDEYRIIWQSLKPKAKGMAFFALEDARSLNFPSGEFDIVYSMSVIEHVDGTSGDEKAVEEMLRVLRTGGLLIISVPFGKEYIEQQRIGFSGAVRETGDSRPYFFQRIYDIAALKTRILKHAEELKALTLKTVWRQHPLLHRGFGLLGQNFRGSVGFANPFLSKIVNRSCSGIKPDFHAQYGLLHSAQDIYGDLVLSGRKP